MQGSNCTIHYPFLRINRKECSITPSAILNFISFFIFHFGPSSSNKILHREGITRFLHKYKRGKVDFCPGYHFFFSSKTSFSEITALLKIHLTHITEIVCTPLKKKKKWSHRELTTPSRVLPTFFFSFLFFGTYITVNVRKKHREKGHRNKEMK